MLPTQHQVPLLDAHMGQSPYPWTGSVHAMPRRSRVMESGLRFSRLNLLRTCSGHWFSIGARTSAVGECPRMCTTFAMEFQKDSTPPFSATRSERSRKSLQVSGSMMSVFPPTYPNQNTEEHTLISKIQPLFTVVVAEKRHHIRFFPTPGPAADRNGNPVPGVLVEKDVTHPFLFDFYLCSHTAIQGTARPTHYHILLNQCKVEPENLQKMIYDHSYQYMRATTPVSVCK